MHNACSWFGSGSWMGFSPVWISKWDLKSLPSWIDFSHYVHYVRPLSTVGEYMVLQNSISTNYFWYSVQGWGFSPVCISKCLPKVPAMLNDFLHSVVQLCVFSPLSLNMCSINFPVRVNDFLHCAQVWGFSPVWIGIWVLRFPAWLNDFLHSVHLCGFSPLWMSMCRIMWLRNSCTCCICLDSLQCVFWRDISWATVPVGKLHWLNLWAMGIEKNIVGRKCVDTL